MPVGITCYSKVERLTAITWHLQHAHNIWSHIIYCFQLVIPFPLVCCCSLASFFFCLLLFPGKVGCIISFGIGSFPSSGMVWLVCWSSFQLVVMYFVQRASCCHLLLHILCWLLGSAGIFFFLAGFPGSSDYLPVLSPFWAGQAACFSMLQCCFARPYIFVGYLQIVILGRRWACIMCSCNVSW